MDLQTSNKPRRVGDGTPGPGRPKGSKNKATLAIKEAVLQAFVRLGDVDGLVAWAQENRTEFYKIAARLIPTETHVEAPGGLNFTLYVPPKDANA